MTSFDYKTSKLLTEDPIVRAKRLANYYNMHVTIWIDGMYITVYPDVKRCPRSKVE